MGRPFLIGIIIQARMGSSRLPGKVLKKIGEKSLLEHILFRLENLKHKSIIVIATTTLSIDDALVDFCKAHNVLYFRGSESNVLERYYQCAIKHKFSHVIRLTADNPFVDIEELDNLITLHTQTHADYSRSFNMLPVGVGSEIFTIEALKTSYQLGLKDNHKEHVNEYIEENENKFKISELKIQNKDKYAPHISLTIDTLEDYNKACFIVNKSHQAYISTQKAIQLCSQFV